MRLPAYKSVLAACAIAAVLAGAGCKSPRPNGAAREGMGIDVAGLDYNVYITRELNLRDAEDRDYYHGPEARPGHALYGVFIKVCNQHHGFRSPADTKFTIEDNQGNVFEPRVVPKSDVFAYHPRPLAKDACIPEAGSAPATGPTEGSMLLFEVPVTSLENRPLELFIEAAPSPGAPVQKKRVELDI
jgi:hypothetical protein